MRLRHRILERRMRFGRLRLRLLVGDEPRVRVHRGLRIRRRRRRLRGGRGSGVVDGGAVRAVVIGGVVHVGLGVACLEGGVGGLGDGVDAIGAGVGGRRRRDVGKLGVRWWQRRRSLGGRVGLAVVGAGEIQRHLRRRPLPRVGQRLVVAPERAEIQRDARGDELGERGVPRPHAVGALLVERDRDVRLALQDPLRQAGEHRAWPHLDEDPGPRLVHRLDLLHETYGLGDLRGERGDDGRDVARVGGRRRVGEDHLGRSRHRQLREGRRERRARALHDRGVKGRRHRQPLGGEAGIGEHGLGFGDGVGRATEHDLLRRVVVGDHDVQTGRRDHFPNPLDAGDDRAHRSGGGRRGLGHELTAPPRDAQRGRLVEHAGRVQRDDLAEAVAADHRGRDAHGVEQPQHRQRGTADGGLRPLRLHQLVTMSGTRRVVERGLGEDDLVQGPIEELAGEIGGAVPRRDGVVEAHREGLAHADVLAALPGEEEGDVPLGLGVAHVDPPRRPDRLARLLGHELGRLGQLHPQVVVVGSHDRRSRRGRSVVSLLGGSREVGQDGRAPRGGPRHLDRAQRLHEGVGVVGGDHHQLVARAAQPTGPRSRARVLLHRDVEVAAAEAEGADARAARVVAPAHPRTRLGAQVEGTVLDLETGVGAVDLDGGREHLVLQRHHRFEQARRARRRLGVTDLRLDAAERAPLLGLPARALLEGELQPGELRDVAGLGGRAVRLEQLHRLGPVAGQLVGAAQGLGLAARARRVHALGPSVGRAAHTAEDGVDAVAVTLGVGEALEGDHPQAFAQDRAVGLVRERTAVAGGAQRRRLAEAHVHEDVVQRVDAPGDHEIAVAEVELAHRHRHRRERARAGRVGHAVGPSEIEAVGDATGHDVAEQAGEGALLPRDVVVGDPLADALDLGLGDPRFPKRLLPHRTLQPADHGREQLLAARHAEDHAHLLAIHFREVPTRRVLEHALGHDQPEQLRGVGRRGDARRDPERHRIEGHLGKERAALGVGLVGRLGIGVVVVLDQPVGRGDVAHEIAAGEDVAPEPAFVERARKQSADADHGDGNVDVGGVVVVAEGHDGIREAREPDEGTRDWRSGQSRGRGRKSKAAGGTGTP